MSKYNIKLTLIKVVRSVLLIGIPFFLTQFPDIANLTIGAVLVGLYDYAKHKLEVRLP